MGTKRVLLVEDHNVLRQSLALLLNQEPDLEVIAQAGSAAEARAVADEADVAVIDLGLPDADGAEVIRELHEADIQVPALVLTVHYDPDRHARALQAGAEEVLTKDASIEEIVAAIKRVAKG